MPASINEECLDAMPERLIPANSAIVSGSFSLLSFVITNHHQSSVPSTCSEEFSYRTMSITFINTSIFGTPISNVYIGSLFVIIWQVVTPRCVCVRIYILSGRLRVISGMKPVIAFVFLILPNTP